MNRPRISFSEEYALFHAWALQRPMMFGRAAVTGNKWLDSFMGYGVFVYAYKNQRVPQWLWLIFAAFLTEGIALIATSAIIGISATGVHVGFSLMSMTLLCFQYSAWKYSRLVTLATVPYLFITITPFLAYFIG